MLKPVVIYRLSILFILSLFSFCFAQEQITITTYYPSPFGSYAELEALGGAIWTTNSWRRAIRVGSVSGAAIQFTNSGAGVQHFGLGASTTNRFYGWYTSTQTGGGDSAHYWLIVNPTTSPDTITFNGNIVANNLPGCRRFNFTAGSGTQNCPAGYAIPMAPLRPENDAGNPVTSGNFLCCQFN